jgi:L-amino acid N-acyltransferase YncA
MSSHICEDMKIFAMTPEDWASVREIYLQGIATGEATFETNAPGWEQWDANHHHFARLVSKENENVSAWAALSCVSTRLAYAGVAEVSVYVAEEARARGLGQRLLEALIAESEMNGIWMLQASIFPENVASLMLHRRCGFREVGKRERIAKLNDVWRSTLLLERRSQIVGI